MRNKPFGFAPLIIKGAFFYVIILSRVTYAHLYCVYSCPTVLSLRTPYSVIADAVDGHS